MKFFMGDKRARGGGKTECGIIWLTEHLDRPNFNALVIRRNSDDLSDWIDRAQKMLQGFGLEVMYKPAVFKFRSGAQIKTGHLKDDQAYTKYQGHEYHRMLIEEVTQIPTEKRYLELLSSCRSNDPDIEPQVFLTANPGGVGHGWTRKRFVDVARPGVAYEDPQTGLTRIFIPAKVDDNPTLLKNDPAYVKRLDSLKHTDNDLYKAWRLGSWDVFVGMVFREFDRQKHVVAPFIPKRSFDHILHMDWGYSEESAFAAHVSVVVPMKTESGDRFNRVITYKEWYGNQKYPNEWAKIIYDDLKEMNIKPKHGYTDPAMHNTGVDGSISIAQMFEEAWRSMNGGSSWLSLQRGINNRIAGVATVHNWLSDAPDGMPYWVITEDCLDLIRTLPELVYDDKKNEDVDSTLEDHCLRGDTRIVTSDGIKSIKSLLGTTGKVLSVGGEWVEYSNVRKTRKNAEVIKIEFSDGSELVCTPDHKIMSLSGEMIEAKDVLGQKLYRLVSFHQLARSFWAKSIICAENIFQNSEGRWSGHAGCTERFGNIITARLKKAGTFITKTTIPSITQQKTLLFCRWRNIFPTTPKHKTTMNGLERVKRPQKPGTNPKKVENGTGNTILIWFINYALKLSIFANTATKSIGRLILNQDFVQPHTDRPGGEQAVSTTLSRVAKSVKRIFQLANILIKPIARRNVVLPIEATNIIPLDNEDVYCLVADKTHVFCLENGLVVSNCFDSVKYCLSQVRFISVAGGGFRRGDVLDAYPILSDTDEMGRILIDTDAFANIPKHRGRAE